MRKLIESAYCDIANAEHGTLVEANRLDVALVFGDFAYTLDLSDANYELILKTVKPFMDAGTPAKRKRKSPTRTGQPIDRRPKEYYERYRAWANTRGIDYGARKGISPEDKAAFDAYEASQRASG